MIDERCIGHHDTGMAKISGALLTLLLLIPSTAFAQEKVPVLLSGIGRLSCAHWQSTLTRQAEGSAWLLGFWTALNFVAGEDGRPQSDFDSAAVISEVSKTCVERPSKPLANAGWETFFALTK